MRIDSKIMSGTCSCGENHQMTTRAVIIEPEAMRDFSDYRKEFEITGRCAVVCDENTRSAENLVFPAADCEVVLNPRNLHADERAVAAVQAQLAGHGIDCLAAVGSGTIHDITRYCAHAAGIPFISCPTAASVDGFCSTVSAMTWSGCKKTMPGIAPSLVIADTKVLSRAPRRLSLSGIGDIIGKYTALADWRITHALNGEHFCTRISGLTMDAVKAVYGCCDAVVSGDEAAAGQLIYALLLSGLAMQLMGNSRPASGAEHHISHCLEMCPVALRAHSDGLHGEQVGVGTIMISEYYHRLTEVEDITQHVQSYRSFSEQELRDFYGEALLSGVLEENRPDDMDSVSEDMLIRAWKEIRDIVAEIPTAEELRALYTRIGMKQTLEDIGVENDRVDMLLHFSAAVRRRITFLRISRMLSP